MKKILEKLWVEYLAEECAIMDTEQERELTRRARERHKTVIELLTNEQHEAVEAYVEILCEIQDGFVKKAFFKGCEFTAAFLIEVGFSEKA